MGVGGRWRTGAGRALDGPPWPPWREGCGLVGLAGRLAIRAPRGRCVSQGWEFPPRPPAPSIPPASAPPRRPPVLQRT